jgi:hypothetical protein
MNAQIVVKFVVDILQPSFGLFVDLTTAFHMQMQRTTYLAWGIFRKLTAQPLSRQPLEPYVPREVPVPQGVPEAAEPDVSILG